MKILYLALTFLICSSVFGQIEQDVNKTSGTESNTISDIDSIRFNANQTEMEIILNNGNIESHTIGDINNVTFSGELVGVVDNLDCAGATNTGSLVEGVAASGVSADIDYTGGNTGFHNGQTINSTGVTGLTATLNAGNFANGAGTLNYTITGTPNSNGTANFAIQIGGLSCTLQIPVDAGAISSLDCAGATINGTLVEGVAASGVSADIDYTGGNAGSHSGQTINSTGVTGLTATLNVGNFANGAGTLNYTITGTPNSNGTANFAIQIGGLSCTLQISVDAGAISSLDCAGATINGTLVEGVSASGISADIDYTGGNAGSHNGQTVNSTGVTGLTATLNAGNFANGAGTLNYTITGTPNSNGTASFAILIGGQNCTLEITVDAAPLAIGDYHEGGIVFYLAPTPTDLNGDGTLDQGLVCAKHDQSGGTGWGCPGTYLGANGTAVGTGAQNTNVMEAGCTYARASDDCAGLSLNGYNDWFLPSKDELDLMHQNKGIIDNTAQSLGCCSLDGFYWSSTENDLDTAYKRSFTFTGAGYALKSSGAAVRAVRAF